MTSFLMWHTKSKLSNVKKRTQKHHKCGVTLEQYIPSLLKPPLSTKSNDVSHVRFIRVH